MCLSQLVLLVSFGANGTRGFDDNINLYTPPAIKPPNRGPIQYT